MLSKNIHHADTNPGVSSSFDFRNRLAQTGGQNNVNQIRGINRQGSTGSGIPKHVTNVSTSIANASTGSTSTITVIFSRDPSDANFSGVTVFVKGYQGNPSPVQLASGTDSPITFIVNNTGEALSLIVQAFGNGGTSPLGTAPTVGISLPKSTGGGTGTTTVTQTPAVSGSAAAGQLAIFSTPPTNLTGGNLSGDVTTAGTVAATVKKIQGTPVTSTPIAGDVLDYSPTGSGNYDGAIRWDFQFWGIGVGVGVTGFAFGFANSNLASTTAPLSMTADGNTVALVNATATNLIASKATCSAAAGVQSAGLMYNGSVGSAVLGIFRRVRFVLKLNQTTNTRIWIGLGQSTTGSVYQSDTPNTGFIGFRYSTGASDAKYQCITQTSNVAQTKNAETTASHVDTNIHAFDIVYDGTQAFFYIDGTLVGQQSGNIPAASVVMQPQVPFNNVVTGNASNWQFYYLRGCLTETIPHS